jgi:hypothetical protein
MEGIMKLTTVVTTLLSSLLFAVPVHANDVDDPAPAPELELPPGPANSPSWQDTFDNGDGTYTFKQRIDRYSTPPHYTVPGHGGGFGIYSWFNQDYGWRHDFPAWADPGLVVYSVQLIIRAYDVDSEPHHGQNGEYDGLTVDGVWLSPQYLQGTNGTWSVTTFDVNPSTVTDDGLLNTWLDIDMTHNYRNWATTLNYSQLEILFSYDPNLAPFPPEVEVVPLGVACEGDDLEVVVTGPTPADPDGDPVSYDYRWFVLVNGFWLDDEFAGRGNHTGPVVPAADTLFGDDWKVAVTAVDDKLAQSNAVEAFFEVGECNTPPAIDALSDDEIDEGDLFEQLGSFTDPDADSWVATVDYGEGDGVEPLVLSGKDFTLSHVYADNGVYTVTVTVDDGKAVDTASLTVTVNNVAPTLGPISGPIVPVAVGDTASFAADFTDPGVFDTHTALFDFGDTTTGPGTVVEADGDGSVTGARAYTEPGIYTVTLTVTDKDGGVDTGVFQYVVVYDPSAGFVTGGGWIDSPEGAYAPDPTLFGRANFGFVSKYKKGMTVPTGSTEFQFHAGDLNFHSKDYDWLVVAGKRAQFKGAGTVNGVGGFQFMLVAVDGDLKNGDGIDRFRIKIWDELSEVVVYDNQMGEALDSEATTELAQGSIVIHAKK